jgi:ATP-binding cassette, subfamily F, member 2
MCSYLQGKYQERYPTNRLEEWRSVVGNYGIPKEYHLLPIKCLSDGLKTRLVFCEISLQNPHLLLFDEPTNAAGTFHIFIFFLFVCLSLCNVFFV